MTPDEAGVSSSTSLDESYCDTCILLNFAQQEWERDRVSTLLEDTDIRFVIGDAVEEEFHTVITRRSDAYEELLSFLQTDDDLSAFDPDVWGNDERHIYEIIGQLEALSREEAATRFRKYTQKLGGRVEYILSELIDEVVFTAPPMFFANRLHEVVPNEDDCKVLAQAADWCATGGSGVLVTMDGEDILEKESEINDRIRDEYDDDDTLLMILSPEAALGRYRES